MTPTRASLHERPVWEAFVEKVNEEDSILLVMLTVNDMCQYKLKGNKKETYLCGGLGTTTQTPPLVIYLLHHGVIVVVGA